MLNKLRNQLLISFISFSLIIIILVVFNSLYIKRKQQIEKVHASIQEINSLVLEHNMMISDFFTYDTKNQQFFETGYSHYLEQQNEQYQLIRNKVLQLHHLESIHRFQLHSTINEIIIDLDLYKAYIDRIVDLIMQRGFQDYGVEGEMRDYIHQLENIPSINLSRVLMLRRHEKDYIIRNNEKYISKLLSLSELLDEELESSGLKKDIKESAIQHLSNYVAKFKLMVELDRQIGIKDNSALRQKIHLQGINITTTFNQLNNKTLIIKNQYFRKLKLNYILVIVVLLSSSILFSFYLSKRITKNISVLSNNISDFVRSNFNESAGNNFPLSYTRNEVGILIDHYKILRSEMLSLIYDLQKKVEKRTHAITCQKERIEQQKEEIEAQRDELYEQNQLIEYQKQLAEQQNKDFISSIQYAKLIQDALLPSDEKLERHFRSHFVLYKPKDIISGDFYWTKRIINNDFNITILATADCTGHGVPGAMMSMLGIALLNEIALKKEVKTANDILDKLREKVIESLQNQDSGMVTSDGMDIGLILYDHTNNTLHFTGANRPLYLIRNKVLTVLDGNKMPIGKHGISKGHFQNNIIELQKNDTIYLFSDGYADQFGGPKNKKFKRQAFKDLLLKIQDETMQSQKQILENEHKKWRNTNRQTDDILVIGIRF